jgi:hypothetical protein
MAQYDLYNIEQRLQELDPNILRIDFDYDRERHQIIAWDAYNKEEYIAMTVPWNELDARVVLHMQRINPERFNAFAELDKLNAIRERDQERKTEDMAHSMADMLYKPLLKDAFA